MEKKDKHRCQHRKNSKEGYIWIIIYYSWILSSLKKEGPIAWKHTANSFFFLGERVCYWFVFYLYFKKRCSFFKTSGVVDSRSDVWNSNPKETLLNWRTEGSCITVINSNNSVSSYHLKKKKKKKHISNFAHLLKIVNKI